MKMRIVKMTIPACLACCGTLAFGDTAWKTSVATGSFTNEENWTAGYPTEGVIAYTEFPAGTYHMDFPTGMTTYAASALTFTMNASSGKTSLTLDLGKEDGLEDKEFLMDGAKTQDNVPFSFRSVKSGGVVFDNESNTTSTKNPVHFSNAVVRAERDGKASFDVHFDAGLSDFADPRGYDHWAVFATSSQTKRNALRVHGGLVRLPELRCNYGAITNLIEVDGGELDFLSTMHFGYTSYQKNAAYTNEVIAKNSGLIKFRGTAKFGSGSTSQSNYRMRVAAEDGGHVQISTSPIFQNQETVLEAVGSGSQLGMTVDPTFDGNGLTTLRARDGGKITLGKATSGFGSFSSGNATDTLAIELDNGTLHMTNGWGIGVAAMATPGAISLLATNKAYIISSSGVSAIFRSGEYRMFDSTLNIGRCLSFGAAKNAIARLVAYDSSLALADFYVGHGSSASPAYGTGYVYLTNSTVTCNDMQIGRDTVALVDMGGTSTLNSNNGTLIVGTYSDDATLHLGGASKANLSNGKSASSIVLGYYEGSHGTVSMDGDAQMNITSGSFIIGSEGNATFRLAGGKVTSASGITIGNSTTADARGTLEISGGEFSAVGQCLSIGQSGRGTMIVSGGKATLGYILAGYTDYTALPEGVDAIFRQTGGEVVLTSTSDTMGFVAACRNYRKAQVSLEGGVFEGRIFGHLTENGADKALNTSTAFSADGGTMRCPYRTGAATLLADFTTATLGTKGLTVDTAGTSCYTIRQKLMNAKDVNNNVVAGALIKTGEGMLTLDAAASDFAQMTVKGGTMCYAEGTDPKAAVTVTDGATFVVDHAIEVSDVTVGDATTCGYLAFTNGGTIAVTGKVSFPNLRLKLPANLTVGNSLTLLTVADAANFDATAQAAWQKAIVAACAENTDYDFTWESDGEGGLRLKATGKDLASLVITVPASVTDTHTTNITYSSRQTLTANVDAEATLNLEGIISVGGFRKTGSGRVTLSNAANFFYGDVAVEAGLLTFPSLAATGPDTIGTETSTLTVAGGTLELGTAGQAETLARQLVVNAATDTSRVILKTDGDITMTDPTVKQGVILKRGAGTLTFVGGGTSASAAISLSKTLTTAPKTSDVLTFDDYGTVPNVNAGNLTVTEGDFIIQNKSETERFFKCRPPIHIGRGTTAAPAKNPRLIVDDCSCNFCMDQSNRMLCIGSQQTVTRPFAPEIIVTNGTYFQAGGIQLATGSGTTGDGVGYFTPRITVDGATLDASVYTIDVCGAGSDGLITLRNEARLYTISGFYPSGSGKITVEADNSIIAKNGNLAPTTYGANNSYCTSTSKGVLNFRNGSIFYCNGVYMRQGSTTPVQFNFHDSEWNPGGTWDFVFVRPAALCITALEGGDLQLKPASGKTYRIAHPITGLGGILKAGAGTVTFDTAEVMADDFKSTSKLEGSIPTLAVTGVVTIAEGTLNVLEGAMRAGVTFAGSGTLTGTLNQPVFKPGETTLNLTDVTFINGAQVDFNGTAQSGTTVTVARYTGTAPSVAGWRAINTGDATISGTFTAADGVISCRLKRNGLKVIIR